MPDRTDVIYRYDGSLDGLLCCVYESYQKNEIPSLIVTDDDNLTYLMPVREIVTDSRKSQRVMVSIPQKIGAEALDFVTSAFLTCMPQKELNILLFLRLGYTQGPKVMRMLQNDVIHELDQAVRHLTREAHLLKGFIRFSISAGVLVARIDPKNNVFPLIAPHFCQRYPEEHFFIYDNTHKKALIYQPHRFAVMDLDGFEMPPADAEEEKMQDLWRLFYDTIEVEGRHNLKCRMTHMPKRYWGNMTEFSGSSSRSYFPNAQETKNLGQIGLRAIGN